MSQFKVKFLWVIFTNKLALNHSVELGLHKFWLVYVNQRPSSISWLTLWWYYFIHAQNLAFLVQKWRFLGFNLTGFYFYWWQHCLVDTVSHPVIAWNIISAFTFSLSLFAIVHCIFLQIAKGVWSSLTLEIVQDLYDF